MGIRVVQRMFRPSLPDFLNFLPFRFGDQSSSALAAGGVWWSIYERSFAASTISRILVDMTVLQQGMRTY